MKRFDRLLYRLARPSDRTALRKRPSRIVRLRAIAGIALRFFWVYAALFVAGAVLTVSAGADIYHRTEVPKFCNACHEMGINFDTWRKSQHGGIKCIDCHARPGLSGWMAAKMAGTSQLIQHFTAKSIEDIHLMEKHQVIVSENCQRCHPGAERLNERRGLVISHKRHMEMKLLCVACHAGSIAHPEEEALAKGKAGLVDIDQCFACHNGTSKVGETVAFNADSETSCANCHPDSKLAVEHGAGHPSTKTRKPCLSCHEKGDKQPHYTMDRSKQAQLCAKCHEPERELVSTHKPFAEGRCDECHRVMSPAHLFRAGPRPTEAFCLGCHEGMGSLLGAKEPATPSGFADGSSDLHRAHADQIRADDDKWCLKCHAAHGSKATRAMVRLAPAEKGEEPGTFTATKTGGSCAGSCHGDDSMEYARSGEGE